MEVTVIQMPWQLSKILDPNAAHSQYFSYEGLSHLKYRVRGTAADDYTYDPDGKRTPGRTDTAITTCRPVAGSYRLETRCPPEKGGSCCTENPNLGCLQRKDLRSATCRSRNMTAPDLRCNRAEACTRRCAGHRRAAMPCGQRFNDCSASLRSPPAAHTTPANCTDFPSPATANTVCGGSQNQTLKTAFPEHGNQSRHAKK